MTTADREESSKPSEVQGVKARMAQADGEGGSAQSVEQLKVRGNEAFAQGRFEDAVAAFTSAIEMAVPGSLHILHSNRSAAYASQGCYEEALADAEAAIAINPGWAKGYGRKGAALAGAMRLEEARDAYEAGLALEPSNAALAQGLRAAEEQLAAEAAFGGSDAGGEAKMANPFADERIWEKLQADSRMRACLSDPSFVAIIEELRTDPRALTRHISNPNVMQALAVMLGLKEGSFAQASSPTFPAAEDAVPTGGKRAEEEKKEKAEEDAPMLSEDEQKALDEKALGNAAYKRRAFDEALAHYDAAIALSPTNASFLANKSAVLFETARYGECIALCEEALTVGQEAYADFKLLGRLYGRIAACHEHLDNLERAIYYYQKSLTEHRTAETLAKLKEAERLLEAQRKAAYTDPALAEEERNAGNELFKNGAYAEAVKRYTEAIRRNEGDARSWANRAACYLKLTAVPEGIKDCDRAIQLDASFVKAYIRKAALLHLKRDYDGALAVLGVASEKDIDGKNAGEIGAQRARCYEEIRRTTASNSEGSDEERLKRAMADPEVREIVNDPVIMQVLQQMQRDPKAAMEHMRNPDISAKVRKLIAAGIIKTSP